MNTPPSRFDSHESDTRLSNFNIEMLDAMADVTEQDIEEVRSALMPELVPTFDEMSKMRKVTLAILFKRDIEDLIAVSRSNIYLVGCHSIGNDLNFLLNGVPELTKKWQNL